MRLVERRVLMECIVGHQIQAIRAILLRVDVSVTGHGNSTDGDTIMLTCGNLAAKNAATPVFTHEVINKLTGDQCSDTWVANGDRWAVVDDPW